MMHLEGLAVYASFVERRKNNSHGGDSDYVAFVDTTLMNAYMNRYFEIYNHFLTNSNDTLNENDWLMLEDLPSNNRLWYRAGSKMAETIDKKTGP